MKHKHVSLCIDENIVNAVAPVIISASRATDIPAFYFEWFLNRFNEGYLSWKNPFNGKISFVSFSQCEAFVFWTKHPSGLLNRLPELLNTGKAFYVLFSLNDYDNEGYENNIASLKTRIALFKSLSSSIGKERVVWRFDPLLISVEITISELKKRVEKLAFELVEYTNKLVFSFIEIENYAKVKRKTAETSIREFTSEEKEDFASFLGDLKSKLLKINPQFTIASCSIPENFTQYGIIPNRCIDDDLFAKIAPENQKLMEFLGRNTLFPSNNSLKDKGQRKNCGCILSKDIGVYNTCIHECVYCYANVSDISALKNFKKHVLSSEGII